MQNKCILIKITYWKVHVILQIRSETIQLINSSRNFNSLRISPKCRVFRAEQTSIKQENRRVRGGMWKERITEKVKQKRNDVPTLGFRALNEL